MEVLLVKIKENVEYLSAIHRSFALVTMRVRPAQDYACKNEIKPKLK